MSGTIEQEPEDYLYHLGLGTKSNDLKSMFGDVKFVCMGGSVKRMKNFAYLLAETLGFPVVPEGLQDLTGHADRYSMYKVGPIISVNHGIGNASLTVVLHELIKLIRHVNRDKDVVFIRVGTSGGIGVDPGTVVITESALDECLNDYYEMAVCGQKERRLSSFDPDLVAEVESLAKRHFEFPVKSGKTMSSNDFYEGQGRLDGAICNYTQHDKMAYLNRLAEAGVINIEMESLCMGAILGACGIKGLVICVTLLNRLLGDQVTITAKEKEEFELRSQLVTVEFIKSRLELRQLTYMY